MNYSVNGKTDMSSGEIDRYQYAVIAQTGLIAVRRPDGSMRMLPGTKDVETAVRAFIALDAAPNLSTAAPLQADFRQVRLCLVWLLLTLRAAWLSKPAPSGQAQGIPLHRAT